jgi:hypothetical protein
VIRTRAKDPDRWPDDIKGVCLQSLQFTCWNTTDKNYRAVMEFAVLLLNDHAIRTTAQKTPFVSAALWDETKWVAEGILSGKVRERVGGANHYCTRALWDSPNRPKWAAGRTPVALINRHAFFKIDADEKDAA